MDETSNHETGPSGDTQPETKQQADPLGDDVEQLANKARKSVEEGYRQFRELAAECLASGRQQAIEMGKTVERTVHSAPLRSVLAAAAVGFVVGIVWRRRT